MALTSSLAWCRDRWNFSPRATALSELSVKTSDLKIAEEPPLGIVQIQKLAQPIHQNALRVSSLHLYGYLLARIDRVQFYNQVNQCASGIDKGFLAGRAERFEAHIGGVFQNSKLVAYSVPGHRPSWEDSPSLGEKVKSMLIILK